MTDFTTQEEVFWHHLGKELEPLLTRHVDEICEKHGDDWPRHLDPWILVIPAMKHTMKMCDHWQTLSEAERLEKTQQVLTYNQSIRELLAPRLKEIQEGKILTDPETGVSFTHGAMQDIIDIRDSLEANDN